MHSEIDNIEIMISDRADEVIDHSKIDSNKFGRINER